MTLELYPRSPKEAVGALNAAVEKVVKIEKS
jgi:hypothetical protein